MSNTSEVQDESHSLDVVKRLAPFLKSTHKPFTIDEDNCLWRKNGADMELVAQYISDESVQALLPLADKIPPKRRTPPLDQ